MRIFGAIEPNNLKVLGLKSIQDMFQADIEIINSFCRTNRKNIRAKQRNIYTYFTKDWLE